MLAVALCLYAIDAHSAKMGNLVCFVKFADQDEWTPDYALYEKMFNNDTVGTNSVKNYFHDMSFGKFDWSSTIVRSVYTDSHNRGYFLPYDASSNPEGYQSLESLFRFRLQTLLKDMCVALEDKLPEGTVLDENEDGRVDNIVMVICGDSDSSSAGMLWPQNNVASTAYMNGIQCKNYITVFDGANGFTTLLSVKIPLPLTTGILCHEMMHTLDAKDLYTSSGNPKLQPVKAWDLMSDNESVPQGMTAYIRSVYGKRYGDWLPESDIVELAESGEYSIRPMSSVTSTGVAYKIIPDKTKSEYFMLEYRDRNSQWDASLPNGGLLVYRVNPTYQGNLGASDKYELYVFRPGGSTTAAGVPSSAPVGPETGRTTFGTESDNAYPFYSDGTRAAFCLTDVRETAEGMSFKLSIGTGALSEINSDAENGPDEIYNLHGMPVKSASTPGIYIISGKKIRK